MPSATTQSSAATPWQDSLQGLWPSKTRFVFDMTKYRKQTSAMSIAGKCPTFRSSQTEEVCSVASPECSNLPHTNACDSSSPRWSYGLVMHRQGVRHTCQGKILVRWQKSQQCKGRCCRSCPDLAHRLRILRGRYVDEKRQFFFCRVVSSFYISFLFTYHIPPRDTQAVSQLRFIHTPSFPFPFHYTVSLLHCTTGGIKLYGVGNRVHWPHGLHE